MRTSSGGTCTVTYASSERPAPLLSPTATGRSRPLLEERVLDKPPMVITALGAVDEHLRLRCQASDFCEFVPGVHRQSGVRTEDHQPLGQTPAGCFLSCRDRVHDL
jgi:hypothetical protein